MDSYQFAFIEDPYKGDCAIDLSVGVPKSASEEDHAIGVALRVQFKCESSPFIILIVKLKFDIGLGAFRKLFVSKKKKTAVVIPDGLAGLPAS